MFAVRLIIITLFIGIDLSQGAWIPERAHRIPRSRCSTCTEDCPEAIAGQWEFPSTSLENYPPSLNGQYQSYSHPQHPFLLLSRPERSSADETKKVLLVYRADADPSSSESELPRALSDRELEGVVTRAILSARRQVEAENALYGRIPFFEGENSNYPMMSRGINARRHPQEFYEPGEQLMRQNFKAGRFEAPRELSGRMYTTVRDPYTVYGGVTDHWEDVNWQGLGKDDGETQIMDPEEFNAVEIVQSEEVTGNVDEKKGETEEIKVEEGEEVTKEEVNPDSVQEIEPPPIAEATAEPEATTPKP